MAQHTIDSEPAAAANRRVRPCWPPCSRSRWSPPWRPRPCGSNGARWGGGDGRTGRVQSAWILVGALTGHGSFCVRRPCGWPRPPGRALGHSAARGTPVHLPRGRPHVAQVDDASTDTTEAFLRPDHDMQSRLNLTSLVEGGQVQAGPCGVHAAFERLGLPRSSSTPWWKNCATPRRRRARTMPTHR